MEISSIAVESHAEASLRVQDKWIYCTLRVTPQDTRGKRSMILACLYTLFSDFFLNEKNFPSDKLNKLKIAQSLRLLNKIVSREKSLRRRERNALATALCDLRRFFFEYYFYYGLPSSKLFRVLNNREKFCALLINIPSKHRI